MPTKDPDNVMICWCIMRQLETESADQIADVMGIEPIHARMLMSECNSRFRLKDEHPSLFEGVGD